MNFCKLRQRGNGKRAHHLAPVPANGPLASSRISNECSSLKLLKRLTNVGVRSPLTLTATLPAVTALFVSIPNTSRPKVIASPAQPYSPVRQDQLRLH